VVLSFLSSFDAMFSVHNSSLRAVLSRQTKMSSIVFLGFFLFELCSSASEWYLITDPPSLKSITEDLPYSVNLTLGYNGTWDPTADDSSLLTVIVSSTNKKILLPVQDRIEFTWEDVIQGYNRTLDVIGEFYSAHPVFID